jgi:hypothetical protein
MAEEPLTQERHQDEEDVKGGVPQSDQHTPEQEQEQEEEQQEEEEEEHVQVQEEPTVLVESKWAESKRQHEEKRAAEEQRLQAVRSPLPAAFWWSPGRCIRSVCLCYACKHSQRLRWLVGATIARYPPCVLAALLTHWCYAIDCLAG